MILNIAHPDPMVYQVVDKFDFSNTLVDPIKIADDLAQTVISNDALGLAANQAGLPYRAFAIRAEKIIVCFNPIIVDSSEETVYLEEGCLSFPGLILKIKRPESIKVRYTEPNGNVVTTKFSGITSRVYQHELDHLDGIVYQRRASTLEINRGLQKKKKRDRSAKRRISNEG